MAKQTVSAMVQGGKASAGPPLGPALGPLGVKIPDVIAKINEKTKSLEGMEVPVKVIVHEDKSFEVEVGSPPVAALIKRELGIDKGSKEPGKLRAGDLSEEQVKNIAKMKFDAEDEAFVTQVAGTARSMGISVGRGAVTEEEVAAYEEVKKAEEEAAAAKAAPAEGEEGKEPSPEEGKEEKPAEKEEPEKKEKAEKQ